MTVSGCLTCFLGRRKVFSTLDLCYGCSALTSKVSHYVFFKDSFVPPLGQKHRRIFCRGKISKIFGREGSNVNASDEKFHRFQKLRLQKNPTLCGGEPPKSIKVKQKGRMKGITIFSPFNSHPSQEQKHLCSWICFFGIFLLSTMVQSPYFSPPFFGGIFAWFTFSRNRRVANPKCFGTVSGKTSTR